MAKITTKRTLIVLCLIITFLYGGCKTTTLRYPKTRRINQINTYHGINVNDPYQWLEEDVRHSESVKEWIDAQNKITFEYLHALPHRESIKNRMTKLWDYEKIGIPWKAGNRYFISKNSGLQNHSVVYTMDSLDGPQQILLNPNNWSDDGTTALSQMSFNQNGDYVAYAIQESGSDWKTWKIRNVETGDDLSDSLIHLKFTNIAWNNDSTGVYYAKYPDPDPEKKFLSLNKDMKVMYHHIGTPQSEDRVVYYQPDHPEWGYDPVVTDDGRYLIITTHIGTDEKYRIGYLDLYNPNAALVDLIPNFENNYTFIDNKESVFYFLTDNNAPNRRIVAIDIHNPDPENHREIIPEASSPLRAIDIINNQFVCNYLKDVASSITLYTLDGTYVRDISLPGLGSAFGFDGKCKDTETFYSFQSFAVPPSIYRYDMVTGQSTLLDRPKIDFDSDHYVTEQVFYESQDGTRIPMFITYKKRMSRNGTNAALLSGYGGFGIPVCPYFWSSRIVWLENGGIYAVANLRGGGEYGETWHEAGKKFNKQNVFDDFMAAAEYLIDQKYTSAEKLAIQGGSNGGLLVGACMTQRPDLFAAAVPQVGVMDMLRYDQFTAGRFWVDEFGSAQENKDTFEYLKGYSPYHNLKKGIHYPATLVITADTDDRVVPGHSFKFAAKLQQVHQGNRPVLIRIETRAGHGSGKPTCMLIEELADIYAFLVENLQMPYPPQ